MLDLDLLIKKIRYKNLQYLEALFLTTTPGSMIQLIDTIDIKKNYHDISEAILNLKS